jgi:hypothetical protein
MKAENKAFIKTFLIAGIVYASIMAGFDYADGQEFKPYKFLFSFLFFGLFMGYIFRNGHKKQLKKEVMESEIKTTEPKSD